MLLLTGSTQPQLPDPKSMITERVRGEFREMPGLSLTLAQAGRLWSLDVSTCSEVLSILVDAGFLARRPDGAFCRPNGLAARPLRMAKAGLADFGPRNLAQV
jgi:hypothetical protein